MSQKTRNSVLGRGVGALLPGDMNLEEEDKFFYCDIDKIDRNPEQPRTFFDKNKLEELARSIREKGVIQPLLVSKGKGNRFYLVAGERRLRAARMVQLEEVPVVVVEPESMADQLELALIENIQRHDLNPIEEARAYARLIEEFGLTQEEVANRVGKKRSTITNTLRLLKLPDQICEDIVEGTLSEGHARVLLRLKDDREAMLAIRNRIISEKLSVRATERICRSEANKTSSDKREQRARAKSNELPESYCRSLINRLTNTLNTRVRLHQSGSRGKIEIEYYSADDLDRLMSLLAPGPEM